MPHMVQSCYNSTTMWTITDLNLSPVNSMSHLTGIAPRAFYHSTSSPRNAKSQLVHSVHTDDFSINTSCVQKLPFQLIFDWI